MLKEFVEAIGGLAVKSKEPKVFRDEFDPRKAYVAHDGVLKETTIPPPLLASKVDTFQSMFEAIKSFGGAAASVWHGRDRITAMLNNDDRLEGVEMTLRHSDQFKAIQSLPKTFDQRALVLFLKRNLAGAIDEALIAIFRQIDFTKREEGGTKLSHGDESLGRSVHAAVTSSWGIPEFITASVLVYSNPDVVFRATIRLSVDIDVQRCAIELTPLPDEIENAIVAAQEEIGERLRGEAPETVTVFYGVPTFRV